MNATDVLREEHQTILQALRILDRFARLADRDGPIPHDDVRTVLDFLTRFADGCHHAKEEEALFPMLEDRGLPRDGGPIGVMLHEHDQGRSLITTMRVAAAEIGRAAEARPRFAVAARAYRSLLEAHIGKENEVLFRMADRLLSAPDQAALVDAFAQRERDALGEGERAKLDEALRALARRYL
jgi:hemerythrin-like domain-containing protein